MLVHNVTGWYLAGVQRRGSRTAGAGRVLKRVVSIPGGVKAARNKPATLLEAVGIGMAGTCVAGTPVASGTSIISCVRARVLRIWPCGVK